MCRELVYLASFVLVLSLASNAFTADDPSLIIYYSFDDVGEIVADQSGKGHDGVVNGEVTAEPGGKVNGAAKFASGSYLDLDGPSFPAEDIPTSGMTLAAWIKCDNTGGHHAIFNARASDSTWLIHPEARSNGEFRWLLRAYGGTTIFDVRSGVVPWGEWVHFAGIYDKASAKAYVYNNGELVGEANVNPPLDIAGDYEQGVRVGYNIDNARPFTGLMDEFFLYNRALSQAEVKTIMQGLDFPYAFNPDPADGAIHEDTWATLAWSPGSSAVSHDVYFSENLDDVKDGTGDTFQGNQTTTFLIVGFPGFAYADGLVPGATYYWRIDEIEADGTTRKGDVWSFAVPPKTADNPAPLDGAEFVDPNVELSWTKGFGAITHTVYFGDNFDDVDNATGGASQGEATYTPGPLELEKVYYWRVDEFDAVDTYKGDVWSFTTPGTVGSLNPSNGAAGVKMTPTLSWTPADSAASHEVYFGKDKDAVRNADKNSPEYKGPKALDAESYDPGKLDWYATYYWRVDAVYDSDPDNPVKGLVWSFTTADFISVDDFESYNDLNPDDPESNRIFTAWSDGLDDPANGSVVGYDTAPFAEQTIVHSGSQSMPLFYDNSVGYSEASMTLVSVRDWTEEGVTKLILWFRGDAANSAEQMFVAAGGSAVVYHDDSAVTQTGEWTEWVIGLKAFADQGVDLTNVDTISIGLGDKNNPQAGGSGKMYIDDIRLYRPAEPVDPGTDGLVAFYKLDGDPNDSSGNGNNGTISGTINWMDGTIGSALEFDGLSTYIEIPFSESLRLLNQGDFTIAAWCQLDEVPPTTNRMVLQQGDRNGMGRSLLYVHSTNAVQSWAGGATTSSGVGMEASVWSHLAVTVIEGGDADIVQLYVNGQPAGEPTQKSMEDCEGDYFIGRHKNPTNFWDGLIDGMQLFNRALSASEVRYLAGFRSTVETDSSLVIYYSFDEVGEVVADQSGKGHDGVVVGDVTAEAGGMVNGAARFATGSYLDLDGPSIPAEDIPTSAMTLAAWINIANTGGDHEVFSARASDESWLIHPEPKSSGDIRWLLRSYGGTTIFQIRAGTVTWDQWLHFAGTYDKESGKAALYINGELIEEMDVAEPTDIAGDWDLGARVGLTIDNGRPFTGLMDEFRMYTRALSHDEVQDIMQGP